MTEEILPLPDTDVDPTSAPDAQRFVALLRRVRDQSGRPYREIARRAGANGDVLPASTLATMLGRTTLPRRDLVVALLRACDVPPERLSVWLSVWQRLAAERALATGAGHPGDAGPVDHAIDVPPGGSVAAWPPPALLPPDVPDFAGRADEVRCLERLLGADGATRRTALPVAGIAGMGGVGKSTLAVHVAHRLASGYPDGQLHVDLRGVGTSPLDPAAVLALFLCALGIDWRAIPVDPAERVSLYRSLMADRRILVVLDDAASADQIRPLLPGTATCAVLVTSRPQLTGVAGARWTTLGMLTHPQAVTLLAQVVGDDRVARQPAQAAAVAAACGGLPLAVRIAGARLAARPAWPLAYLASLLGDRRQRLDGLVSGDLEVRASLALSYEGLAEPARRLFALLGLFDVPDFTSWFAAAVLETAVPAAVAQLESLVDAQLVTMAGVDCAGQFRYRCHDLVRLYARERADAEQDAEQRTRALERGLGAWLAVAERMAPHVPGPCYAPISGSAPRPAIDWADAGLPDLDPLRWFDAERATLLSAVHQACDLELDEVAFDLAGCLEKYFDVRGMYADWEATNVRVMATCQRAGNVRGEATMLRGLIDVRTWLRDGDAHQAMAESQAGATQLLRMFTTLGDRRGMSDAEVILSWAYAAGGRHAAAVEAAARALRLAEETDHLGGQARAHVALAVAYREQSRLDRGIMHLRRALGATRVLGNLRYEATVLQFLGIGHLEMGDLEASEGRLAASLALSRGHRDDYTEALTLLTLARLHSRRGDPRAPGEAGAALAIARKYRMGHHIAASLTVLGEIALAAGRPAEAVRHLTESVAIWRARGWLSYEAAALTALGHAHSAIDPAAAREAFLAARDIHAHLGNTKQISNLDGLLHQAGTA